MAIPLFVPLTLSSLDALISLCPSSFIHAHHLVVVAINIRVRHLSSSLLLYFSFYVVVSPHFSFFHFPPAS